MRIGIDFDNTIVCYDQLFWTLAREQGVIDELVPRRKDAVRDNLRQRNLEPIWTSMQGQAYGARILEAEPFAGVMAAFQEFRRRDWDVCVVSHKTQTPYAGGDADLHAAARHWLSVREFFDSQTTNLAMENVFLELTKRDKLQRIADAACDWFIDDLPELLTDADFPSHVGRILFDPHKQFESLPGVRLLHDWNDIVPVMSGEVIQ